MSRAAIVTVSLACLLIALDVGSARAWQPLHGSQPTWCGAAPYALGNPSSDLGQETTRTEVRRGMDDWAKVSCTGLVTEWNGTTGRTAGTRDGASVIGWVESGWPHSSRAIGVTGPLWDHRGCIIEAEMEMNGVYYTWTTDSGRGNRVNAYSIILHEGGHYYGLGHSRDRSATMYASYGGGISSLSSDDRTGICTLYPGDGGAPEPECSRPTDCGSTESCVDGRCRRMAGDGSMCSACPGGNSDCGGREDYCLTYPDGGQYCAKACVTDGDCESPDDRCVELSGVRQCVRLDGAGSPDCSTGRSGCTRDTDCPDDDICNRSAGACEPAPTGGAALGASCDHDEDCRSRFCVTTPEGGVCSRSCDWLEPTSCPDGFYCDGDALGVCDSEAGVCMEGTAGAGALGAGCEQDTDCESLYCDGGKCASPCIRGGASGCPEGYECQRGEAAGCGACKMAGGLGEGCEVNDDCASNMCATRSDETFCTDTCASKDDCPAAFACEPVGEVSVCVPPDEGPRPRQTGFPCDRNADCNSSLCASDGDSSFCTEVCESSDHCPEGFECVAAGDDRVCAPGEGGRKGGGCAVVPASRGPAAALLLLIVLPALVWLRRRSRRRT